MSTANGTPLIVLDSSQGTHPIRRRALIWALNGWLIFHVLAIIVAPAAVSPTSELMQSIWRVFQPYLQILYLNNGYHFFAPIRAKARC